MRISETKVFRETLQAYNGKARLIANRGGTRSGKTYSIMQFLVLLCFGSRKPISVDVVAESLPHLKRGAFHDFEEIVDAFGLVDGLDYESNKSDHAYTFSRSGCVLRFFSADNWGKVKGSRRDVLFINEANRLEWEIYRQLAVRTTQTTLIDFNPDSEFWFERNGLKARKDTVEIVSTYLDNPYLSSIQVAEIESYKSDERWWKVYGLGQTGTLKGLIYQNWQQVDGVPAGARLVGRGLDFGYTNDPTAVVAVYIQGGELYVDEELYNYGLTNDKIAKALKGCEGVIIADSAEQKSIQEIRNYGVRNIDPVTKGKDSVRNGIQIVQRYRLNVTQRSLNLIKELRNYKWAEDRMTGELRNEPAKNEHFDHALDALRYVCMMRLAQRRVGTAKAHINRL